MERKVVITGLGIISPLGIGLEKNWTSICEGRSGIGRITKFDASQLNTKIAGEIKDFNPEDFLEKKQIKRMDPFIQHSMAASIMAVKDSGLDPENWDSERTGVIVGTGFGGLLTLERNHSLLLEGGPKKISPFFIPMMIANMASGHIAMHFSAKGPNTCIVTACASGSHAIGEAYQTILREDADIMIAGGTEATLSALMIGGFEVMKALSSRNEEPQKASRPFDRERDGFVAGEGSGILILENLESAKKRGARIYAEIIGYGLNSDAFHITAPSPNGEGARLCMEMALKDGEISYDEVDYINAHGSSTVLNDLAESQAMKKLFKDYAYKVSISSTKSMTGHLLGAAGGVEALFTVLAIYHSIVPPTINYEYPDPECDLDYTPNAAKDKKIKIAMSNSFGFGGTNASLIFRNFE